MMKSPSTRPSIALLGFVIALSSDSVHAQLPMPKPALTVDQSWQEVFAGEKSETRPLANFRLRLHYGATKATTLRVGDSVEIDLPKGDHLVELIHEQQPTKPGFIRASVDGEVVVDDYRLAGPPAIAGGVVDVEDDTISMAGDFTALVEFKADPKAKGTLIATARTPASLATRC